MNIIKQFAEWVLYVIKSIISLPYSAFKWYFALYKGRPWYKTIPLAIFSLFCGIFFYLFAVFVNFLWLFGDFPETKDVMNTESNEASLVYYADGTAMGRYFRENRQWVNYRDVNPMFFKTLIDTEDERFYSHKGVDVIGLFAAAKDIFNGNPRGASTITQQLAKNLYNVRSKYSSGLLGKVPGVKILIQKTKEMLIALQLELVYDKQTILELYVNTVDFGSNAKGLFTASRTFFGVNPSKLKTEDCAMLVGLLKATSTYNPKENYDLAMERRNIVINNLYTHHDITLNERNTLMAKEIDLTHYKVANPREAKSPYVWAAVKKHLRERFQELGLGDYDLDTDGLRIYTSIDPTMQKYAEAAVREHMKGRLAVGRNDAILDKCVKREIRKMPRYRKLKDDSAALKHFVDVELNTPHEMVFNDPYDAPRKCVMSSRDSIRKLIGYLQAGFIVIEPSTHRVKAWVGNVNFKTWDHDNVTQTHQSGSTFKGMVYACAMERGWLPSDICSGSWSGGLRGQAGPMPLINGFRNSINGTAVNLCNKLGYDSDFKKQHHKKNRYRSKDDTLQVLRFAKKLGIRDSLYNEPRTLALGGSNVKLRDLANAYATILSTDYKFPILVTKVTDRYGRVIYSEDMEPVQQVVSKRTSFLMKQMLHAGMTGTSRRMHAFISRFTSSTDFGGKTGTTNSATDCLYMGVIPNLVGGVWTGGQYRDLKAGGQGAETALPIWGRFIAKVLADKKYEDYKQKFPTHMTGVPYPGAKPRNVRSGLPPKLEMESEPSKPAKRKSSPPKRKPAPAPDPA